MIPAIIHQTWRDENIPYNIYEKNWIDSWKKHNPSWEYKLWTDAMIREATALHYPELLPLFDKEPGVVKGQIGRFLALYHYGGLYVDLDYECLRSFEVWRRRKVLFTEVTPDRNWVSDALMMAEPGLPLFRQALRECKARASWTDQILEKRFSFEMLTDIFPSDYRHAVMPYELFSPCDWTEGKCLAFGMTRQETTWTRELYPDAYAATYWTHNW